MTDQCKHCSYRGNLNQCQAAECSKHGDWYPMQLQARIDELEQWVAAIADDHPQIPDWIRQSARSLLAGGAK